MRKRRDLTLWVAICFLLLWALLTHSHANSWNDTSRLASVEALVYNGTWNFAGTAFGEITGDRLFLNGYYCSDKPPVLSFLAAGVYTVLHKGLHISFDPRLCDPASSPCYCFALLCSQSPDWAYYIITLTLVGLPSALMLALFYRLTALFELANPLALLVTGALGLGTLVLPYSLVFNNHAPAAACLMAGFYALIRSRGKTTYVARWLAIAGLATSLAFTFDLVAVPFLASFFICAWFRHRWRARWFLLGSLAPLLILAALDWWAVGDPLPPAIHSSGYDYPGSLFPATVTGNTPASNVPLYGFQMIFGPRGLFGLSPVLIWSVFGLWALFRKRGHWLWIEAVSAALACLVMVLSLVLFTPGFGGLSFGTRWLTEVTPILFFFAAWPDLYRSRLRRLVFCALAALSIFAAWQGALSPWTLGLGPFRLIQYATSNVGRYLESQPSGTLAYTTLTDSRYIPIYPTHAWHTSLRTFDPGTGALPAGDPDRVAVYLLNADDQATRELLETTFPDGQWDLNTEKLTVYHVPPHVSRVRYSQPLEAEFAGLIRLIGYDPPAAELCPGDTLSVRLYWQALAPIRNRYTAFVHVLGPQNPATASPLWAQDDHQPGQGTYPTDRWFPGEVVLDRFQITIPEDAPPGEYRLTTGFYDWVTLQRLVRSDTGGDTAELARLEVLSEDQ